MPIATPPADFDPTIVPPVRKAPTEAETRDTGIATDAPITPEALTRPDKHITDLVKLWPQDRPIASLLLAWQLDA
ncbi:hypothetical protein [Variovorax sp. JS1663]|uniref:hypothetical protein n=1 Tax=Variovorax sp. JS1663 TaxID=1851577 RepID=UPI000B344B3D|nr:hypothetical protein [Variovorax sp. JS1663]OUM03821.1 hypothetical protein A8M77_04815 [Variovorax sp. JS1663]